MIYDPDAKKIPTVEYRETSVESRNKLQGKRGLYRGMILDYIREHGGTTCDEIEIALEMRHQTASCFISFMTAEKLLTPAKDAQGKVLKRLTRSGRSAIVWVLMPERPFDPQGDIFLSDEAVRAHTLARYQV